MLWQKKTNQENSELSIDDVCQLGRHGPDQNHDTTLRNQPKTMKHHETTLKNQGNQPKPMKHHETTYQFSASGRVNVTNKEDVAKFFEEVYNATGTSFNMKSGRPDRNQESFRGFRMCIMNVSHSEKSKKLQRPNLQRKCPATITFCLEKPREVLERDSSERVAKKTIEKEMYSNQSGAVGGIILGVFQGSLTHLGASRRLRGQKYIKAHCLYISVMLISLHKWTSFLTNNFNNQLHIYSAISNQNVWTKWSLFSTNVYKYTSATTDNTGMCLSALRKQNTVM